jgi:flagellar hook-associated protein 3 FlgL
MRITQGTGQLQFVTAIQALEEAINQSQSNITSNQAFTTAGQNPIGAGAVNNYKQALSSSQQFASNASSAQTNLQTEDNALSQVQNQLQSLRTLALQANSGTLTNDNRLGIASQVQQIQNTLLQLANTRNGNGEYIFSGFNAQNAAFSLNATGATYNGDQGQRQIEVAPGQTVADGDSGDAVFNQIKSGNGTFTFTSGAANTGQGVIGSSSVQDVTAYDGGSYTIKFTAANAYQVLDSTNNVVSTGTYTDGGSINFKGVQVSISGAPATGDTFSVAPSTNQSLFTTVQNLLTTLNTAITSPTTNIASVNKVSNTIDDLDQVITQLSNVRAGVGGRLNTITAQQSVQTSQQTQLQRNIANIQGLDYASAITTLDQQQTTLSAALQSYMLTQGLSLFKFLSGG